MADPSKKPKTQQPAPSSSNRVPLFFATLIGILALAVAYLLQTGALDPYLPSQNQIRSAITQNTIDVGDPLNRITYRGTIKDDVEHFQSIFYAHDTSGLNRFAPPVPFVPAPKSVVDATKSGAWCLQVTGDLLPFTSKVEDVSENCLSLRIARPVGAKRLAGYPVVVFLHGGGHGLGSAYDILYEPDGLVRQSVKQRQPTIYVGVNYRVGIFGFADSDALRNIKHTNIGLLDQRAALEWVQKNIAVFGGDSSRITVVGQSAGAADIAFHMTSNANSNGSEQVLPFQRAVMMSGAGGTIFNQDGSQVKERTAAVAEKLGCVGESGAQSNDVLQCLRKASGEEIRKIAVDMSRSARPPFGEGFFQPYVDGGYIADRVSTLMREGKFVKNTPVIAGYDYDDGAWYAPPTTSTDADVISTITQYLPTLSQDILTKLLALYPESDFTYRVTPDSPVSAQYYRAARINRDLWFTCPTIDYTFNLAKRAGAHFVRLYETNQTRFEPALGAMGVPFWGVPHLSSLGYLFANPNMTGGVDNGAGQLELAKTVSSQIVAWAYEKGHGIDASGALSPLKPWGPAYTRNTWDSWIAEAPVEADVMVWGGDEFGTGMAIDTQVRRLNARSTAFTAEKVLERCAFVNSEEVRKEMGV